MPTRCVALRLFSAQTNSMSSVSGIRRCWSCEREWFRKALEVVDRDLDLERPVVAAAESFGHACRVAARCTVFVEPCLVLEADGFHDQRIVFPVAHGVAVPPRLELSRGQLTAVDEDLTLPVVGFVEDRDEVRCLNDLSRLRVQVQLDRMQRQTMRIRVILAVLSES